MERDTGTTPIYGIYNYFNSHAHVERDYMMLFQYQMQTISTHTLTWSVTGDISICNNFIVISTHTLTWSVTIAENTAEIANAISTHTLTWSVTEYWNLTPNDIEFQLTRSRGA